MFYRNFESFGVLITRFGNLVKSEYFINSTNLFNQKTLLLSDIIKTFLNKIGIFVQIKKIPAKVMITLNYYFII